MTGGVDYPYNSVNYNISIINKTKSNHVPCVGDGASHPKKRYAPGVAGTVGSMYEFTASERIDQPPMKQTRCNCTPTAEAPVAAPDRAPWPSK